MKRLFFFAVILAVLTAGCTTKEQDQKIQLFWMMQMVKLMQKLHPAPAMPAGFNQQMPPFQFNPQEEKFPPTQEMQPQEEQAPQPVVVPQPTVPSTPTAKAAPKKAAPFMEITMVDEKIVTSKAPARDRKLIQQAFNKVQQENESTLQDIRAMFDERTAAQAAGLMLQTEKALQNMARTTPSFKSYLTNQQRLLHEQEHKLNLLMQRNAGRMKNIRA